MDTKKTELLRDAYRALGCGIAELRGTSSVNTSVGANEAALISAQAFFSQAAEALQQADASVGPVPLPEPGALNAMVGRGRAVSSIAQATSLREIIAARLGGDVPDDLPSDPAEQSVVARVTRRPVLLLAAIILLQGLGLYAMLTLLG